METDESSWEPPEDWDPYDALMRALGAQSRGEPVNEDEASLAADTLAAVQLMRAGLTEEEALDQFERRDHKVHISFDGEELSVEIEFVDQA